MSYKIAAIKESVGVEEIEAVGTDHSFWKFGSKKERKDRSERRPKFRDGSLLLEGRTG